MDEPIELEEGVQAPTGKRWTDYQHAAEVIAQAMNSASKEKFVYTHTVRCPSCHEYWTFQVAAPIGTLVEHPHPLRVGMGLLCGACEGKRRAILVIPGRDGVKGSTGRFWSQADTDHAWGILRGDPAGYSVKIVRSSKPWDGVSPMVDDKQYCLDLLFKREGGRRSVGISQSFHAERLPNWNYFISTPEER